MSKSRQDRRPWRALLVVVALLAFPPAARGLDLRADAAITPSGQDATGLADPAETLDPPEAAAAFAAGQGMAIAGPALAMPQPRQRHWFGIDVRNPGAEAGRWHVVTPYPFHAGLAAYLARADGTVETLLDSGPDTPFAGRPIAARLLVGVGFRLAAGEEARLLLRHRTGPGGSLPVRIEPAPLLAATLAEDALGTGLFHGAAVTALVALALFSLAVGRREGLIYAWLLAIGLLLVAQIEGIAFRLFWPGWPRWNTIAALPIAMLLSAAGAFAAGRLLAGRPRWRRACNALALLCLGAIGLIPFLPLAPLVAATEAAVIATFAGHALVLASLAQRLEWPAWVAAGGALGAALAAGAVVAGAPLPEMLALQPQRIVYLVLAGTVLAVVPGVALALRRAHEAALRREVLAAQRDADLNRRLFETERAYSRARDLAAARRRDLAAVSHDIGQPLASLRLALDGLAEAQDDDTRRRLAEAFDYLDGLVHGALRDAAAEAEAPPPATPAEPYAAALLTGTLDQMFREEAEAKGLAFACSAEDAVMLAAPILPLLRLLSNLVANAVRHCPAGEVSVSAARGQAGVVVTVADTGPGLSAEDLERFGARGQRGPNSAGHGLGLAIVAEHAAALGADIAFDTAPGQGVRVRVTLPG